MSSTIGAVCVVIIIVASAAFTLRAAIAAALARREATAQNLVAAVRSEERRAAAERERGLRGELAAGAEAFARATARLASLAPIEEALTRLAQRNLTIRVSNAREVHPIGLRVDRAVALIGKTMFAFSSSLDAILGSAAAMNASVDAYSDEISKLAARTEAAASALAKGAESAAQLAAPLSMSASSLRALADETSLQALTIAQSGRTLGEIRQAAHQIAPILTLVDELAFQTNFLALNAGVEAARLGDTGRGVAVVAQELRALSKRAADAAKQSSALLSRVVGQAERGVGELSAIQSAFAAFSERAAKIIGSLEQTGLKLTDEKCAGEAMRTLTAPLAAAATARIRLKDAMTIEAESLESLIGKLSALIDRFEFDAGSDGGFRATPSDVGAFADSSVRARTLRSLPSAAARRA